MSNEVYYPVSDAKDDRVDAPFGDCAAANTWAQMPRASPIWRQYDGMGALRSSPVPVACGSLTVANGGPNIWASQSHALFPASSPLTTPTAASDMSADFAATGFYADYSEMTLETPKKSAMGFLDLDCETAEDYYTLRSPMGAASTLPLAPHMAAATTPYMKQQPMYGAPVTSSATMTRTTPVMATATRYTHNHNTHDTGAAALGYDLQSPMAALSVSQPSLAPAIATGMFDVTAVAEDFTSAVDFTAQSGVGFQQPLAAASTIVDILPPVSESFYWESVPQTETEIGGLEPVGYCEDGFDETAFARREPSYASPAYARREPSYVSPTEEVMLQPSTTTLSMAPPTSGGSLTPMAPLRTATHMQRAKALPMTTTTGIDSMTAPPMAGVQSVVRIIPSELKPKTTATTTTTAPPSRVVCDSGTGAAVRRQYGGRVRLSAAKQSSVSVSPMRESLQRRDFVEGGFGGVSRVPRRRSVRMPAPLRGVGSESGSGRRPRRRSSPPASGLHATSGPRGFGWRIGASAGGGRRMSAPSNGGRVATASVPSLPSASLPATGCRGGGHSSHGSVVRDKRSGFEVNTRLLARSGIPLLQLCEKRMIAKLAMDQFGSRYIQQCLENCSHKEKRLVFEQVSVSTATCVSLCEDVFGNYVVQKLFEHGTAEMCAALSERLFGKVLALTKSMYGCRVVQKALESVKMSTRVALMNELRSHVEECVRDQNGNHVIQKAIAEVPCGKLQFVLDTFVGNVATFSTHPYGCRVIQRLLERTCMRQKRALLAEILKEATFLSRDQYGNYVVQHVIEFGDDKSRRAVIDICCRMMSSMSKHKFGSNVVEKAFAQSNEREGDLLLDAVLGSASGREPPIVQMVRDQYGNYVIQKVLEVCSGMQRERLIRCMIQLVPNLRKLMFGKHIIAKIERITGRHLP